MAYGDNSSRENFLEKHYGCDIQTLLRRLYIDERKTMRQVAKELCVTPTTVNAWMRKYSIPSRKMYFI